MTEKGARVTLAELAAARVRDRLDGALERSGTAQDLQHRLNLERDDETSSEFFVSWKLQAEQPLGWEADLSDGRPNIRSSKTAEVLRHNRRPMLNIGSDKDRAKGKRINDHHLTLAEKRMPRADSNRG